MESLYIIGRKLSRPIQVSFVPKSSYSSVCLQY